MGMRKRFSRKQKNESIDETVWSWGRDAIRSIDKD